MQNTIIPHNAEALRAWRAVNQVSQGTLAAVLGISKPYMSALEHGARPLPPWFTLLDWPAVTARAHIEKAARVEKACKLRS